MVTAIRTSFPAVSANASVWPAHWPPTHARSPMDEPFGAVDPVVRERLQNEFLKLQAQVRKTVLFVTHDIEEAVRLGDRIAVYGQGRIEQFDSPATVLGAPATPYVADFVGADRGLKRLSVTPIEESDLDQPPVVHLDDPLATTTNG
ncbi:hypothetical protein SBADM41S_08703 [Streptomyces badius]